MILAFIKTLSFRNCFPEETFLPCIHDIVSLCVEDIQIRYFSKVGKNVVYKVWSVFLKNKPKSYIRAFFVITKSAD